MSKTGKQIITARTLKVALAWLIVFAMFIDAPMALHAVAQQQMGTEVTIQEEQMLPEAEDEYYEYELKYEEEIIGIVPMSGFTPPGVPTVTGTNLRVVATEADLRSAITATVNPTVIRLTADINVTGGVMTMGGTDARRVYIYSDSADGFTVTRTAGADRIIMSRGITNIHNVHFTTNINPRTATANRGGLEVNRGTLNLRDGTSVSYSRQAEGGGIRVTGGSLVIHDGLIYNNVSTGRGGGIFVAAATATLNENAVVDRNRANHAFGGSAASSGGGGGVAVRNGGTLNVNNATISRNHAENMGGGISVSWGAVDTGNGRLNINGIRLLRNEARGNGGGLHTNTRAIVRMEGEVIIDGNRAHDGGGIRIFSMDSTNFYLTAGSRIVNNVARMGETGSVQGGRPGNGAGLSVAHTGTGGTDSNANNIGFRISGVVFENNHAVGIGGAIHHEAPNMAAARGIEIGGESSFIGNHASDGGAISVVLQNNNNNLPTGGPATGLRISTCTTFQDNFATNGFLVDENLAVRNQPGVTDVAGSRTWYGPRINTAGEVQEVTLRNHVWNNYDIITRNRMEGRNAHFNQIGTAARENEMSAELTETRRSTNHAATQPGFATTAPVPISPYRDFLSGSGMIRNSRANFFVTYVPWNADIVYWVNTQTTRNFVVPPGYSPEYGEFEETYTRTVIDNTTTQLSNVDINQHTRIEVRIDFRYHDITFVASPSTATTGGTVNDAASVVRNLRESSATQSSLNTPGGLPIGTTAIPNVAARDGWGFIGWTGPGLDNLDTTGMTLAQRIAAQEAVIAATFVSGPMTFTANFEQREAHSITLNPPAITVGNLQSGDFTATVLDQFGTPMPNQNSFVINWTSNTPANVTVSPASNPAGQTNTTTATATLMAAADSSNTIRATLGTTNIYAEGTVNVTFNAIAHSIRVTPTPNNIFRGESVELTATVLDQFGVDMPNQNNFAITWTSGTPANVGISPATSPAGQANTTTATASTAITAMDTSTNVTATLTGNTAVSGTAVVNVRTEYSLTIANRPDNIGPHVNQTQSQEFVRPGTPLSLNPGTTPAGWTFLGWTTDIDAFVAAITAWTGPDPATWTDLLPAVVPVPATMPSNNLTAFAIWGNQYGVPFVPNYYDITVRVVNSQNQLVNWSTLAIDPTGAQITPNNDGTFTLRASLNNVGHQLTASALGFQNSAPRAINQNDVLVTREITINLGAAVNIDIGVRVERYSTANQLITTSTLAYNSTNVLGAGTGIFTVTVTGYSVGRSLTAAAPGFTPVNRGITIADLEAAPGPIVITLGGSGGYEYEYITTNIIGPAPSNALIPHSVLTPAERVHTNNNNGTFVVRISGAHINTNLYGNATGFNQNYHTIHYTDLARVATNPILIQLAYADATPLNVRVERYVAGGTNEPLTTAALTRNGVSVTPNVGGTFTFNANGSNIGNVLEASHYGFAPVQHIIVDTDLEAPRLIVIVLGGPGNEYRDRALTVRVEDVNNNLIPHAQLSLPGVTITPGTGANAGIFTMTVDGQDIDKFFTASASGFTTRTDRQLLYTDLHNGTLTIVLQHADATALNVRVERYVAGGTNEPLTTAALTRYDGTTLHTVTPNVGGTFTFNANGSNIGNVLEASHYGFAPVQRTIVYTDLNDPRTIVIVLGGPGNEYRDRDITVRVEDVNNNLIPHAQLSLPSVTITPGTGANAGIFTMTVDGQDIDKFFTASASGFTTRTDRQLLYTDLHNGTLTIVLQYADTTPLTVHVYSSNGTRIPTAALTRNGNNVTRSGTTDNYHFTIYANGNNIGDTLVASAPGFTSVTRVIADDDLEAPRVIKIILGDPERRPEDPTDPGDCDYYDEVTFTVEVREGAIDGLLVSAANLVVHTGQVNPAAVIAAGDEAGRFTITADGRNVGDVLRATATGFASHGDHTITYQNLAGGTFVIVLNREGFNLNLANVPATLTHTGQSVSIDGTVLPNVPTPAIPGSHNVVFGDEVVLTAGGIAQNHYFLGWYRMPAGAEHPALLTHLDDLVQANLTRATGVRPNPYTGSPHTFPMPAENIQYLALWGARDIIGASAARITFHSYGVGNFGVDGEGNPITSIEIPVEFGETLNLARIEQYLASEEDAFAFWGWFEAGPLNAENRVRNGHRRPTVGTFGFEGGFGPTITDAGFTRALSFTEAQWNALGTRVVNGSLDLHAVWSRWGDVNDDDEVDIDDIDALRRHVFGLTPRNPINEAPGDVLRDGFLDIDDIDVLRRNVFGLTPRLPMGQRPAATPASLFGARMDNASITDAVWSISQETISPDATYVDIQVRLDQIPTGGIHGDGISSVFFEMQYDPTFLSNPRRAEILTLDRTRFSATQQMMYDMFVTRGWTEEDFIADSAFATAVVHAAEGLGGYGFGYALWNGENDNAGGHDRGENIISLEWSPATNGSHDSNAYVFVTFRFDVATDVSDGDVAYIMSNASMHAGGITGSIMPGSVTIIGGEEEVEVFELEVSYVANETPSGMSVTVEETAVVAVGTHELEAGTTVTLYAGEAEGETFLGWMTAAELAGLPTNEEGYKYAPDFAEADRTVTFDVTAAIHMIALWGNENGVIGQSDVVAVLPEDEEEDYIEEEYDYLPEEDEYDYTDEEVKAPEDDEYADGNLDNEGDVDYTDSGADYTGNDNDAGVGDDADAGTPDADVGDSSADAGDSSADAGDTGADAGDAGDVGGDAGDAGDAGGDDGEV